MFAILLDIGVLIDTSQFLALNLCLQRASATMQYGQQVKFARNVEETRAIYSNLTLTA